MSRVLPPALFALWLFGCSAEIVPPSEESVAAEVASAVDDAGATSIEKIELTEDEWRAKLTPMQFSVLREDDTEPRDSGALLNEKREGTFRCAGCDLALFASDTKFESGTGWPSYWAAIDEQHVGTEADFAFGWIRTEAHCARCDGHLGHVFDDGPEPTGKRWCINSASLVFEPGAVTTDDRE